MLLLAEKCFSCATRRPLFSDGETATDLGQKRVSLPFDAFVKLFVSHSEESLSRRRSRRI